MEKIKLRQICFLFIGMMPITKLLIYPAILPYYAQNDVVLSALFSFILQGVVIGVLLYLSKITQLSFFQLLQNTFGSLIGKIIYFILALFLVFASFNIITEQKTFVMHTLYENVPTYLTFIPYFLVSFFACTKGLKSIGRMADICLPIFALSFVALITLGLPATQFSALLPIGGGKGGLFRGSLMASGWYLDCLYPLFFLGHFKYEKKTFLKAGISYAIGAFTVLVFVAVFYGIYGDISILRQNSMAHIAKFTTAFTSIGRVDFIFVFALTLVHIAYSIVPLQLATSAIVEVFPKLNTLLCSAIINAVLLFFVLILNFDFASIQYFYHTYFWIFAVIFAYLLPIAALFLKKNKNKELLA